MATADKLVNAYINIRNRRAELAEEEKELVEKQNIISEALLELFKSSGTESLRTKFGTATRTVQERYWTSDWERFFEFMKEHDVMLVQKRIATANLKQFMEENPDLIPPGLNSESTYTVSIRRK